MVKIKVSYETNEEKEKLLNVLMDHYDFRKKSRVSEKGPYKKIYVDLKNKSLPNKVNS